MFKSPGLTEIKPGNSFNSLCKEDGEEGNPFSQCSQNDGNNHDLGGCTGVTSGGICGFCTNESHPKGGSQCGDTDVNTAGYFGQEWQ
jgi:hypothetical protein